MSVTADITATYRGPGRVMAKLLAMGQREDRALALLMAGCAVVFIAQMPRLAREAHLSGQELNILLGGALLAENAGAALDEIEQVSNQIASLVQNISSSARQQAGSAADVTRRTTRLREIGDETGKATTATAASISKLSELATQLRKTVEGFALPPDMLQTSALARTPPGSAAQPAAQPKPQVKAG